MQILHCHSIANESFESLIMKDYCCLLIVVVSITVQLISPCTSTGISVTIKITNNNDSDNDNDNDNDNVCARLAQLVRSLTTNQEVLCSIPGLVEG